MDVLTKKFSFNHVIPGLKGYDFVYNSCSYKVDPRVQTSFHPPDQIKSIGFVLKTLTGFGSAVGKSIGTASHSFKGKHGCRGVE